MDNVSGLSPWVRGTRRIYDKAAEQGRFIPVGAGNSLHRAGNLAFSAVYPRGCGELYYSSSIAGYGRGLSPWVRGTLCH